MEGSIYESMENLADVEQTVNSCKQCLNSYDRTCHRPRCLPCGHSFCSICIQEKLKNDEITCSHCYSKHPALCYTDIPVNSGMEDLIPSSSSSLVIDPQTPCPLSEEPEVLSSCLSTLREEHCREIEKFETEIEETRSQIRCYKSQLDSGKEEHQSQIKNLQSLLQKHQDVLAFICKERANLEEASGQGDQIMQKLKTSVNDLTAADTKRKLFMSIDISCSNYDIAKSWNSDVKTEYSNNSLILKSQELREESKRVLRHSRSSNHDSAFAESSGLLNISTATSSEIPSTEDEEVMNIRSKIEDLQANLESRPIHDENPIAVNDQNCQTDAISFMNGFHLKPRRCMIGSNAVFATGQNGKLTSYARITFDEDGDTCIHWLQKGLLVPPTAICIPYKNVVGADFRPGLCFFDLSADGHPLGRLFIRLKPAIYYSLNFHYLCTGVKGVSFADTSLYGVIKQSGYEDCIGFGNYWTDEMVRAAGVVPIGHWQNEFEMSEIKAGSLFPLDSSKEFTASRAVIYTKDKPNARIKSHCFGRVEKGLEVLEEALSLFKAFGNTKVVIADCGIVLPNF